MDILRNSMSRMIEKILEILQFQTEEAVDLFNTLMTDRSTSYRMARRSLRRYSPPEFKADWANMYRKRQAFHSIFNKLKREGFIEKKNKKRNQPWSITKAGLEKLAKLREISKKYGKLPSLMSMYKKKSGEKLIIIAFDIPEVERRKRVWLRAALISLGFKKLQQSVWMGKIGIPPEFMEDLKENFILSYVHIFSVNKGGTINEESMGYKK